MAERFKVNFQKIESQEDNTLEKREFTERAYNNLMLMFLWPGRFLKEEN
jgi:hypothetical protein